MEVDKNQSNEVIQLSSQFGRLIIRTIIVVKVQANLGDDNSLSYIKQTSIIFLEGLIVIIIIRRTIIVVKVQAKLADYNSLSCIKQTSMILMCPWIGKKFL